MGDTVITTNIQKLIGDAREAARKKGIQELGDNCKKLYEEYPPSQADVEIQKVLSQVDNTFLRNGQPHARRGGVSAVAAVACTIPRQLQHDSKLFEHITGYLLPYFKDMDPQTRLLAVEGMMNVLAHLKKNALEGCFKAIFPSMLVAASDREIKIQQACAELSNVVKEVAAENPGSFIMTEFVTFVKNGLQNRQASPEAINFVHQWITIVQSIPVETNIIHFLDEFLGILLQLVSHAQHGVAGRTEKILKSFLEHLKKQHRAAGGGGGPKSTGAEAGTSTGAAGEASKAEDEATAAARRKRTGDISECNLVSLMETTLEHYNTQSKPRTREIAAQWCHELLTIGQGQMLPIAHRMLRQLIRGISDSHHQVADQTRHTLNDFADLLQHLNGIELQVKQQQQENDEGMSGATPAEEGPSPVHREDTEQPSTTTADGKTTPPVVEGAASSDAAPLSDNGPDSLTKTLQTVGGRIDEVDFPAMINVLVDSLNSPQPSRLELLQWAVLLNDIRPTVVSEQLDVLFPAILSMLEDPDSQVLYRTIEVLSIIAGEEKFSTFIRQLLDALEGSKELLSKANIIFKRLQALYTVRPAQTALAAERAKLARLQAERQNSQTGASDGGISANPTPTPTPTNNDNPPTPSNGGGRSSSGALRREHRGSNNSLTSGVVLVSSSTERRPDTDRCEQVFLQTAKLLEEHPNKQFAATLIVTLTAMLLTGQEFMPLREVLKRGIHDQRAKEAFVGLYPCWCYNPVSAIALCLLTKTYDHAYKLVEELGSHEASIHTLVQLDRLVQLLEAPVFAFVRLALLQPKKNASLVQALFGIQMILPQGSPQFKLLQQRLVAVTAVSNLGTSTIDGGHHNHHHVDPSDGLVENSSSCGSSLCPVDWEALTSQYKLKQLEMAQFEHSRRGTA